jgi:hypothetical protein
VINEEAVNQAVADADRLAREFLRIAGEDDMELLTRLACDVYQDRPHLLPMMMGIWHSWAREAHGQSNVHRLIENMALNIADAPVEDPRSRGAFCGLLFAMEDGDGARVQAVWEDVMERGGWDTAVEVISLFLGFTAYFMGWIDSE